MLAAVLCAIVVLTSSLPTPKTETSPTALSSRMYSNGAQITHGGVVRTTGPELDDHQYHQYRFMFTEAMYRHVAIETLTMTGADVIERSIDYHPHPNFEVSGSRYFYRRDPKASEAVEIELVDAGQLLFREVRRPNRFFHLPSLDHVEYINSDLAVPHYVVTFTCNAVSARQEDDQRLAVTHIDRSITWTPRYVLNLPKFGDRTPAYMNAFADIRNDGDHWFSVAQVELIPGEIRSLAKPTASAAPSPANGSLDEWVIDLGIYSLNISSPLRIPPHSSHSLKFIEPQVNVEALAFYSDEFSPLNKTRQLVAGLNISCTNEFLPGGHLSVQADRLIIGVEDMPDLEVEETYLVFLNENEGMVSSREVTIVQGDAETDSIEYRVEYEMNKTFMGRELLLDFYELFPSGQQIEVKNLSTDDVQSEFTDNLLHLRTGQKQFGYNVVIHKVKSNATQTDQ